MWSGRVGAAPSFATRDGGGMRACAIHPPVYGFSGCFDYPGSVDEACCYCRGGCCCSACLGYRQIPSQSGSFTMKCGGTTDVCGDAGRMGMVCVSYNS